MMQSIQRDYWSKIWCAALLLALCALLVDGVPARAQSSGYRVAILTPGLGFNTALDGFREGLAQLGYTEGKNITFMIEDVQGDIEGLANRATKLVAAKPDLLFTLATAPTAAARKATATLPILFAFVADPLRSGWSPAMPPRRTISRGLPITLGRSLASGWRSSRRSCLGSHVSSHLSHRVRTCP